jgi:GDP-L-fucose synthase
LLADALKKNDWNTLKNDLNQRPIEGITGNNNTKSITAVLERYGIYPDHLTLWGTGMPLREFLWSEDMADASVYILEQVDFKDLNQLPSNLQGLTTSQWQNKGYSCPEVRNCHINIGTGKELTIAELAQLIQKTIGYEGEIHWDHTKPDGTMRKRIDVSKLHQLGWQHQIEIEEGIKKLTEWYKSTLF